MVVQANGIDNANFATPADGQHPTCNMYLWDQTNPERDGDLENDIPSHGASLTREFALLC